MKEFHLTIQSRNKKSINIFLLFFFSYIRNLNFHTIKKYFQKKCVKKILTILKSPHVNKKAQEQFEFRYFSKQLTFYTTQSFKCLIFIKQIKNKMLSDIKIKTKLVAYKKSAGKLRVEAFNLDNFQAKMFYNNKTQNSNSQNKKRLKLGVFRKTQNRIYQTAHRLLKVIDVYGEFERIYLVWVAQLVEQRTENPCDDSSNLSLNKFIRSNEKLFMEYVC